MSMDRRTYIGGSDIAGILGLQPKGWRTALQIWQRKVAQDGEPVEETPREQRRLLARGQIVEPLVARMLEVLHRIEGATRGRRYTDPDVPFFAAEIDFELPFNRVAHLFPQEQGGPATDDETVNVEIKTVHPFSVGEWGEEGTDEVPIHYAAQVYWGLGVTRRRLALCAALFGADDLVLYPMAGDEGTIAGMRDKAQDFWVRHVLTNTPPPPQTLQDVARLWPDDDGSTIEADDTALAALRTLRSITAARKSYEDGEDGVSLLIREYMKNATTLRLGDIELATLKAQKTQSIDVAKLKEQFPDAYKATLRTGTTRVLRPKEKAL